MFALCLLIEKQGRKLYIDAGKDLKIHKISKSVTLHCLHYLLKKIDLEMLPHLKMFLSLIIVFIKTCVKANGLLKIEGYVPQESGQEQQTEHHDPITEVCR